MERGQRSASGISVDLKRGVYCWRRAGKLADSWMRTRVRTPPQKNIPNLIRKDIEENAARARLSPFAWVRLPSGGVYSVLQCVCVRAYGSCGAHGGTAPLFIVCSVVSACSPRCGDGANEPPPLTAAEVWACCGCSCQQQPQAAAAESRAAAAAVRSTFSSFTHFLSVQRNGELTQARVFRATIKWMVSIASFRRWRMGVTWRLLWRFFHP